MWPFNRHKHNWKIIRILQGEQSWAGFGKRPVTQIYWKCEDCKKTDVSIKDGWWDWEDLT